MSETLTQWTKDVERETKGQVKINMLATSIGKPEVQFDTARDGVSDIGLAVAGYTPGRFVLTNIGALANVGANAESISGALWRVHEKFPEMQKEFEGVRALCVFVTTGLQMWNNKRYVETFNDYKGIKLHVSGGIIADMATALGAAPVTQPTATAYESVANGVTDGITMTINGIQAFKIDKIVKYGTVFPGGYSRAPIILVMNQAKFNGLSKENQAILLKVSGEKLARHIGKIWEEKDLVSLKEVKELGVKVNELKGDLLKQTNAAADQVTEKWLAEVKEKRSYDGREFLKVFRDETKKIESGT
jgi:TRAP-type C4-dicarboxylate transport system substrate-binding protein